MKNCHPVVNLLRINKNLLGVDVDKLTVVDKEWIKVSQSLFDSSCDTIKQRILTKIKTHDINALAVSAQYPFCNEADNHVTQ